MTFRSKSHLEKIKKLTDLWSNVDELNALAQDYGIKDIFQDNGAKILQQAIILNFKILPGREGNDAIDARGNEWEMKSANIELVSGFSTHHHLNFDILKKYRKVPWSFAFYRHTKLEEIYVLSPENLKEIFDQWENKLNGIDRKGKKIEIVKSINNPKIPIKYVRENGVKVFPFHKGEPVDPCEVVKLCSVRKKEKLKMEPLFPVKAVIEIANSKKKKK